MASGPHAKRFTARLATQQRIRARMPTSVPFRTSFPDVLLQEIDAAYELGRVIARGVECPIHSTISAQPSRAGTLAQLGKEEADSAWHELKRQATDLDLDVSPLMPALHGVFIEAFADQFTAGYASIAEAA
jgi:hypothetical protein